MITAAVVKLAREASGDLTDLVAQMRDDGNVTLYELRKIMVLQDKFDRVVQACQSCITQAELNKIISEEPQQ